MASLALSIGPKDTYEKYVDHYKSGYYSQPVLSARASSDINGPDDAELGSENNIASEGVETNLIVGKLESVGFASGAWRFLSDSNSQFSVTSNVLTYEETAMEGQQNLLVASMETGAYPRIKAPLAFTLRYKYQPRGHVSAPRAIAYVTWRKNGQESVEVQRWAYSKQKKYFFPYSSLRNEFLKNLNLNDELVINLAVLVSEKRHLTRALEKFDLTELPDNYRGDKYHTHMVPLPPMMFDISGEHHIRVTATKE